ncbi:MAG: amidohydrolase family protein [Oscillospiraceae bacterium]|nr:amidohydrolase family protein [Oscillospiraceae bacterium]
MYCSNNKYFSEIRQYLDNIPVIETHEHYTQYHGADDALDFVINNYYWSDYMSAGGDGLSKEMPPKERYERFLTIYNKSKHTAYAQGMIEGLRICWGIDNIDSYENFLILEEKLKSREASVYENTMEKLNIKAKVVDSWDFMDFVDGNKTDYSKYCRFAFQLPEFHNNHSKQDLLKYQKYLGRAITCLDDYLESFDKYLQKCVDFGVVCFKDQTAYRRSIAYGNPTRDEAEKVFNAMMINPRETVGDDRAVYLDDWLFQYAMRKAAQYNLPVQIHTGHMAGIRNDIVKTNAAHLIPAIEMHENVKFDLFHGNWPYMDEYIYIGKNYPNVYLNLCWVQSIDPVYCVEFMKRAVMTVPHSKIMAFGGDTSMIEWVAGYLSLAKDNVSCALSELTDSGWLNIHKAKQIAADWFFNNPNDLFKLGFEPFNA